MVKAIKTLRGILLSVTALLLAALIYGFYCVPDEIYTVSEKPANVNLIYTLTYDDESALSRSKDEKGRYKVNVSLFNIMPVKDSSLTVSEREYVAISGELFGLRLFTEGIIIVGVDDVDTNHGKVSPAKDSGLQKGDIIEKINGFKVASCNQVSDIFEGSSGEKMKIEYVRNGKHFVTEFNLAFSESEGKYKAGIWIRDSAAGIGTMTFCDVNTSYFAGLGHGVCDIDTGDILPVCDGDIVNATVNGCYKGKSGKAGELCGVFSSQSKGFLYENCATGVYGRFNGKKSYEKLCPVATVKEVSEGKAQIVSTVDSGGPRYYDIEITKISKNNGHGKNMVIKVTDKTLIEKTGGIVQGMSGSPIVQNGMLVGAVTHVFINDPTQGYAIFADTMLSEMNKLKNSMLQKAS